MKFLHTMLRVKDIDRSLAFWQLLRLQETRRQEKSAQHQLSYDSNWTLRLQLEFGF
jgi:catechol 2,3-dioxygenase-like lactoylglutathione lyase family enzyme